MTTIYIWGMDLHATWNWPGLGLHTKHAAERSAAAGLISKVVLFPLCGDGQRQLSVQLACAEA